MLFLLEKAVAALPEKKWYILWFSRKDLDDPWIQQSLETLF